MATACPKCGHPILAVIAQGSAADKPRQLRKPLPRAVGIACIGGVTIALAAFAIYQVGSLSEQDSGRRPSGAYAPPASTTKSPEPDLVPVVTREKYDRIQVGMTYDQVRRIIGASGQESNSEIGGQRHSMYIWMNGKPGSVRGSLLATFIDGKLFMKQQSDLP